MLVYDAFPSSTDMSVCTCRHRDRCCRYEKYIRNIYAHINTLMTALRFYTFLDKHKINFLNSCI